MMNSVNGVEGSNSQLAFQAKWKNNATKKQAYKTIDKINQVAVDFMNKDRPIEEQREIAMRRTLNLSFFDKIKLIVLSIIPSSLLPKSKTVVKKLEDEAASKTYLKSFIKDKTVYYTAGFIKPLTKNPVTKK